MFARERQSKILSLLQQKRTVTTTELIQMFQVSIETIRRDLLHLEKQGALQRVHGGAMIPGEMRVFTDYNYRMEENKEGKIELSQTAASLLREHDIICIDGSSATSLYFATVLRDQFHHLTIATNGLSVFNVLAQKESFDLVLCGGHYACSEMAFCGQQTLESLRALRVQKAFVCPSALSLKDGVCDYSFDMQPIQKQIISCAEEVFFLADSNKFEKRAMLKLADMSPHYTYVTDSGLHPSYRQLYEENGLHIITKSI